MKRFCPRCGKEIDNEEGINNFCIDCYLKDKDPIHIPDIEITVCVKCGKIKYQSKWFNNFEEVEKVISKNIKVKDFKQPKITTHLNLNWNSGIYSADISIDAIINDKLKRINKNKTVHIKKDTCLICSRIAGNYYTSILQIRFNDKKLQKLIEEKIKIEINKIIDSLNSRTNKVSATLHIIREKKQSTGFDLYLDNMKLSYNLTQHLMKHISAISYNTSKTLVGVSKDGLRVYRTTFCVHFGEKDKK